MFQNINFSLPERPYLTSRISPHASGVFRRRLSGASVYCPPDPIDGIKTLVLDLDETLIHSSEFPPHKDVLYFKLNKDLYVYKRPGLDEFLNYVTKKFEVFVYTYGVREYAEPILNTILPLVNEEHRLFRDSCILKKGNVIKDLKMLKRAKSKIMLIDDNDQALKYNPRNTIVIPTWDGMPSDESLTKWLIPLLDQCNNTEDVRDVIGNLQKQKRRYSMI